MSEEVKMSCQEAEKILSGLVERIEKHLADSKANVKGAPKQFLLSKLQMVKDICLPIALKDEITQRDVVNASAITCYGSLAYCCGLSKECIWRDAARAALHVTDPQFTTKEDVMWVIIEHSGRKVIYPEEIEVAATT
jgi:predicted metal-binding transcription factor (methanogenesis marker protein 9)